MVQRESGVRLGAGLSPLLIGFDPPDSSSGVIVLRRAERGVRRLDCSERSSESGSGRAAALSTVSSERDELSDLLRLELELRSGDLLRLELRSGDLLRLED